MATTKNLCAQIPIDLHERVSEERERLGQTTSEYITNLIQEYNRLREMVDDGELARVASKYYLPGTVVPQEEQEQAVISYLRQYKSASYYDLRELLGLERKQCGRFLRKMVSEGKLKREGSRLWLSGDR